MLYNTLRPRYEAFFLFKLKDHDHVVDHDCDIAAVTVTWLPDNDVRCNSKSNHQ